METTIKPPEKLITDNEILKEELKKIQEKTSDSKNELSDFERIMIAALKKEQQRTEGQSSKNDLESIVDTLTHYGKKKVQAIQLNKVSKTEKTVKAKEERERVKTPGRNHVTPLMKLRMDATKVNIVLDTTEE